MKLEQTFAAIRALLERDTVLAAIPFLCMNAENAAAQESVTDYNAELERALLEPGLAFVATMADGELVSDRAPALDLNNLVLLSLIENTEANKTGRRAVQILNRALLVLHRGQIGAQGARVDVTLNRQAYQLGPISRGKVVYFINLLVRTTEQLGPVSPANP